MADGVKHLWEAVLSTKKAAGEVTLHLRRGHKVTEDRRRRFDYCEIGVPLRCLCSKSVW